jgi:hypothetical protein
MASWPILRIAHTFAAGLNDKETVGLAGVSRLVPLQLAITHESTLVRPLFRVRCSAAVELVGPDERVVGIAGARLAIAPLGRAASDGALPAGIEPLAQLRTDTKTATAQKTFEIGRSILERVRKMNDFKTVAVLDAIGSPGAQRHADDNRPESMVTYPRLRDELVAFDAHALGL